MKEEGRRVKRRQERRAMGEEKGEGKERKGEEGRGGVIHVLLKA